ncbi:MAG: DegQ family serine endoprotease [Pseudomonadota bacterium]
MNFSPAKPTSIVAAAKRDGNQARKAWLALLVTLFVAATTVLAVRPAEAAPAPESFADLAEKLLPSVVNVSTKSQVEVPRGRAFPGLPPGSPLDEFFRRFERRGQQNDDDNEEEPRRREAQSLGSGFIIGAEGLIVTNNHVVEGADEILVRLTDGRELEATIIGRDEATDLALLRVEADEPLPAVEWGSSDEARVGDWVVAIGNPFGLGGSVTAGIISARSRDINAGPYDDFIQTDASINRGNSGGPMFNLEGKVIGINTAIFSPTGGNVGIGFAIPSEQAQRVIDQIREFGKARRGWLGVQIQLITDDVAEARGLEDTNGAIVSSVNPNSPADKAGLQPGDIIREFNGEKIEEFRELPRVVANSPVGEQVKVLVLRDGKTRTFRITLGEFPTEDEEEEIAEAPVEEEMEQTRELLGMDLRPLTDEMRERFDLGEDVEGVVVVNLDRNSDAARKGMQPSDVIAKVNQASVTTVDEVVTQLDAAREAGRKSVLLWVYRGETYFYFAVRLADS